MDPNCHCWDATQQLLLNPAAWQDAAAGQWSNTAGYYNSYRWQRQPSENANFGRTFRMGHEGKRQLQIRAEMQNIFNRTSMPCQRIRTRSPQSLHTNAGGALSAGYGFVNTVNGNGARPRTGLMVARFTV